MPFAGQPLATVWKICSTEPLKPWLGPLVADLTALEAHLENRSAPTFALYGPRMDGYAEYRGIAPLGTIDALRDRLRSRPGWQVVLDADGVTVFRYVPAKARTQEAATWRP